GRHVQGAPALQEDRPAADPLQGPRREERVRRGRPRPHHRDAPHLQGEALARPGNSREGEGMTLDRARWNTSRDWHARPALTVELAPASRANWAAISLRPEIRTPAPRFRGGKGWAD